MNPSRLGNFTGRVLALALVLTAVLARPPRAVAQSTHGMIVGTVTDTTKAVLLDANVTVTNTDTAISRTIHTNSTGYYEVPDLVPGPYRLEVQHARFKSFVRERIVIESRSSVRVDATLSLEDAAGEVVEVTAGTPVIETEGPAIADSRTAAQLEQLPSISSVEIFAFMFTMPGIQSVERFTYSFNGSRSTQNEFTIDGISSPRSGTPLGGTHSSFEMISEIKLLTANNSAEFGSPGVISIVSKSGTNKYHGSAYMFRSDTAFDARNFFAVTKPKSTQNVFGASLGGPVVVPGLYNGRNRTFFLLSYYTETRPKEETVTASVPTLRFRGGDFSQFPTPIIDPRTGAAFPGNLIPADRISPIALRLQERFYPQPNQGDPNGTVNNLVVNSPLGGAPHRGDARIDQKVSERNSLFLRYGFRYTPQDPLQNIVTIGRAKNLRFTDTAVLSDTHTFSDHLVNEARFGFQRSLEKNIGPLNGREILDFSGIQGITSPGDSSVTGMPSLIVTGFASLASLAHENFWVKVYEATDVLAWIKGSHSFRGGADLQHNIFNDGTRFSTDTFGTFRFTGFFTGNGYADFLLGLPERSLRAVPRGPTGGRQNSVAMFLQDDWRVKPKVTLSFGLRYEYQFAGYAKDGLMYNLDPATMSLVVPDETVGSPRITAALPSNIKVVGASAAGFPRNLRAPDKNNLLPRLGFAIRPTEKWVVRGGYGIFSDSFGTGVTGNFGSPLFGVSEEFRNTDKRSPTFTLPGPFGTLGSIGTISASGFDKDLENPFIHQWNLTAEHAVGDVGLRASYIGTWSKNLAFRYDLNLPPPSNIPFTNSRRPFPEFGSVNFGRNGAKSIYHALQVDAERRFGKGFYSQVSWTWSKVLSNIEDTGGDLGPVVEDPNNLKKDYGREAYSVDHRINVTTTFDLPFGKGRRFAPNMPAWLDAALGGWALSGVYYFDTGRYFTPSYTGTDPSGTGRTSGRPDRLADGNLSERTLERWFDAGAFVAPPANLGRFGNAGRNILQGPPLNLLHLALAKKFRLWEGGTLQIQLNARNALNHPNFNPPNANISDPLRVGRIAATRSLLEEGGPRKVQLEGRLSF